MLNVMLVHVHVYQNIKVIHTEVVVRNVYSIQIAPEIVLVIETNVLIRVLVLADKMHYVTSQTIFQCVVAQQEWQAMHF